MKLYASTNLSTLLAADKILDCVRLMSDYEVNLVNDSMQEFFVRFYGPKESASTLVFLDHRPGCTDQVSWSCVLWVV